MVINREKRIKTMKEKLTENINNKSPEFLNNHFCTKVICHHLVTL